MIVGYYLYKKRKGQNNDSRPDSTAGLEHRSRPISSLRDPAEFGPPPKRLTNGEVPQPKQELKPALPSRVTTRPALPARPQSWTVPSLPPRPATEIVQDTKVVINPRFDQEELSPTRSLTPIVLAKPEIRKHSPNVQSESKTFMQKQAMFEARIPITTSERNSNPIEPPLHDKVPLKKKPPPPPPKKKELGGNKLTGT